MKSIYYLLPIIVLIFCCAPPIEEINSKRLKEEEAIISSLPKTKTLGIVWDKYPLGDGDVNRPLPIFPTLDSFPAGDYSVSDPWVIKVSDTEYRMWYTKITDSTDESNREIKDYRIFHATSTDGIKWEAVEEVKSLTPEPKKNSYDESIAGGVRVCSVNYSSGIYKMWYLGKDNVYSSTGWKLYYAWSYGGYIWKRQYHDRLYQVLGKNGSDQGEFYQKSISGGSVLKNGSDYLMWLGGYDKSNVSRLGVFLSNLGTQEAWKRSNIAVNKGFAGTFDVSSVESPFVLKDDGVFKMWYSGKHHTNNLGLAYSLDGKRFYYYSDIIGDKLKKEVLEPHPDGTRWERYGFRKVCIIRDDDNSSGEPVTRYKMWYTAEDNFGKFRIGYAESHENDQ